MNREGFRKFLESRDLTKNEIEGSIEIVEEYETFLRGIEDQKTLRNSTCEEVQDYSSSMIERGLNSYDNYVALALYGLFIENNGLYLGVLELLDGAEALDNLYMKVGESEGEAKRDLIFDGIELPPLGNPNSEKPIVMQAVMERLADQLDPETSKRILGSGLRDLNDERYLEDKRRYEESSNIDEYLEKKGDDFIAQLEQIQFEKKLFFNQEITDEVIAFVDSVPEIRQGVREGNIIYDIKIPHMTIEYLAESDEAKKRYYYCHCPWVKESLKDGPSQIPVTFCNCSAAFHKKSWEVIFERTLEAEIVESVLQGDLWCKIAIMLPESKIKC
jgi:hypothetical protein